VTRAIEDFAERLKNNMPEYIVGIDRGGAIAAGLLAKRLRFHRDCPKLRLIHRADKHECGFASGIIEDELKGKSVLVVDDACRRGDTMAGALGYIEKTLQPAQVRTFVILLVKGNCARPVPILGRIDYHAYFTTKLTVTLPWDAGAQS
jgi:hypoxanthine phosphoribosyltransferase